MTSLTCKGASVTSAFILAVASASLLITASTGLGAYYAYTTGAHHGLILSSLGVTFALGLELSKALAIDAALIAFGQLRIIRGMLLGVLGIVAVIYSVTAELSLLSMLRGTASAERAHLASTVASLEARHRAIAAELEGLPSSRPVGVLEAELAGLVATPGLGDCSNPTSPEFGKVSRKTCPLIAALKVELATANRRAELTAAMGAVEANLAKAGPAVAPDPAAASIVAYASTLGFTVDVKVVSELLTLIPVIALELGSSLSLVLVRSFSSPVRNAPEQGSRGSSALESGELQGGPNAATEQGPEVRLLDYVRAHGGRVEAGQRALARALGLSTTRLNGLIRSMRQTGRLKLDTAQGVTVLSLV